MQGTESGRSRWEFGKRTWVQIVLALIFLALGVPGWADDKAKDEETLKNASKVLDEMLGGNAVPAEVLARANCVIVLPSVKKFGFGVGGSGGRGPMSCRGGKEFNGKWSAPAMYSLGGASVGLQVGGSATDYVLLIMSQKAVDAMLAGKIKLGNEATAAAGPSGATATSTIGGVDILTYAKASGLFAGASLGSATLEPDKDANKRLYAKDVAAKEILVENAVKPTPGGEQFVSLLDTKAGKHRK